MIITVPFRRVFFPSGADLVTDGEVTAAVWALTTPPDVAICNISNEEYPSEFRAIHRYIYIYTYTYIMSKKESN